MSQITKRALEQSLKHLLLKKPLTKITINDIAEDCGINRMTFYYHFKDIYDLVEWSCLEDAKKALNEKKTYETWQQGLLQIFEAAQENKPFILNVYRCVHREQVEKYLQPLVDQLLLDVLNEEVGDEEGPGRGQAVYCPNLCLHFDRADARLDQRRYARGPAADRGSACQAHQRLDVCRTRPVPILILSFLRYLIKTFTQLPP